MNKKINQLGERVAVATDLMLVGDPSTGTSYKSTLDTLPLVPYIGATGAVNLGAYDLTVNSLTVGRGASANINNTVIGSQAGASFTTAQTNVAIGEQALKVHSTGNANTAVGRYAMLSDVDGSNNTAVGTSALVFLASGGNTGNTAIGVNGLSRLTSGSYNTWLGYTIGTGGILTSGSYNTILGAQINVGVASLSNNIILADGQGNIRFRDDATSTILSRLAGTGTRMVVTDANGALSTQGIPTGSASGGSSISYYLNGGTAASVSTYYQMSKTPVLGTGADFSVSSNGLIAQFLTDVADPNRLEIPAGNWNFEMYFSSSSAGGTPNFYVELLKYNGTTFTSITSSSAAPEDITGGTSIDLYITSLAIPQTTLLATDRLAIRIYVVTSGRTITLHTQDSHLCEIITNFAGGVSALNGLTANTQYFAIGTSGTNFSISSSSDTHTFNLPTASGTNRGALSSTDWTTFNSKQAALTLTTTGTSGAATLIGSTLNIPQYSGGGGGSMAIGGAITSATAGSVLFAGASGVLQQDNANFFWDDTNNRLGIGTATPTTQLNVKFPDNNLTAHATFYPLNGTSGVGITYEGVTAMGSAKTLVLTGNGGSGVNLKDNLNLLAQNGTLYAFGSSFCAAYQANSEANLYFNYYGYNSGLTQFRNAIFSNGKGTDIMKLFGSTGNLVIQNGGTFTDAGYRLDVNGTARVTGKLSVGTPSAASALMEITSTTQGFLPPRMTTTQKNAISSPAAGLMVFDLTLVKLCVYNGSAWETITSI